MKKISTDYLIIGGGLAGCVFAYTLRQRGLGCILVDTPLLSNASRISAGIINPISGKRFSPLWDSHNVVSTAERFYAALEAQFSEQFFRPLSALRLFTDADERELWFTKRASTLTFADYVPSDRIGALLRQEFGGIGYTAWHVDVAAVVMRLRRWLNDNALLLEEVFEEQYLTYTSTGAEYKHISARRVVLCNGWTVLQNSLWKDLPLSPAKGELLTIQTDAQDALLRDFIIKGVFLLPLPEGLLRVGASYSWDELDETPTPETAENLIAKAQAVFPVPMRLLRHDAGVRPAAQDSKPILGVHPLEPRSAIMNGFGSKGAAYTPFCAEAMIDFLETGAPLADWCALRRWKAWR
jgi:glycine/D-amino acid oxidase-like deaminating enzyme